MNLNCICVVDNNITPSNKKIIEQYGSKLICVNTREKNQSFQERRIEEVKKYINSNSNTYWSNQYNNELIPKAYFSLAKEINLLSRSIAVICALGNHLCRDSESAPGPQDSTYLFSRFTEMMKRG